VNVVLLDATPPPPLLSATLPVKLAGTVAGRKLPPLAGVVTDAVAGLVVSLVTVLVALPWLPTASVTQTRIVFAPSVSALAGMLVSTVAGAEP
jgi:hypothetical protein